MSYRSIDIRDSNTIFWPLSGLNALRPRNLDHWWPTGPGEANSFGGFRTTTLLSSGYRHPSASLGLSEDRMRCIYVPLQSLFHTTISTVWLLSSSVQSINHQRIVSTPLYSPSYHQRARTSLPVLIVSGEPWLRPSKHPVQREGNPQEEEAPSYFAQVSELVLDICLPKLGQQKYTF